MAVAGGVLHTVIVGMTPSGEIVVVRREQAQSAACFGGTPNEVLGRLLVGRNVRLTERAYSEYRAWEEKEATA